MQYRFYFSGLTIVMKKIILLFCFFIVTHAFSQSNTDRLNNLLKNTNGKEKVNLLNQISKDIRNTDVQQAKKYAIDALTLSKKENYKEGEIKASNRLADQYLIDSKYDSAFILANAILADKKNIDGNSRGESYAIIAESNWHLGKFDEAIMNYMQSANLRKQENNSSGYGSSLIGIGYVYQSQNKLTEAEKYIKLGLEAMKEKNDPIYLIKGYHALANTYGMGGKLKEALAIDSIGLALAINNKIETGISMFYDNMANCYLYSGNYKKANEYFRKSIPLDTKFNNNRLLSDTYLNLGNMYFMQQMPNEAILFLDSSILLADKVGYKLGKQKALQLLSDAYKEKGDDAKALAYLNKMIIVKDSIVNETREKKIAELQTLYETDKIEKEIQLQKAQLSKQQYIIVVISIGFLLVLLILYGMYKRRQVQQESKLQSAILHQQNIATEEVLAAEEKERKRIAGDLHDGVGQMMSAVKMNLSSLASKLTITNESDMVLLQKTISLIDESCKEVRSVSHNMMPNALLKAGLSSAVKEFIEKIDHSKLQVNLYTEGLQERLNSNYETVLYRVIQEVVNNVIKHANANKLDISLLKDKDGISCTIEDNGIGFITDNLESYTGIGLKNIQTRIKYLKGTVEWDSNKNEGTLVAIHVPLTN